LTLPWPVKWLAWSSTRYDGCAAACRERHHGSVDTLDTVQDDRTRLLQIRRCDLDSVRRDWSTWSRLAFALERTDDGRVFDGNGAARFGVLRAAQYDRRSEDLPLLRFLLQQEIVRYREVVP
jgi:hypothetical protein